MEAADTIEYGTINQLLDDAYSNRVHNLKYSVKLATEALLLSRKHSHKSLIGKSLNQLSLFYMIQGAYKRSVHMAKEAIRYFEELQDDLGIADAKYSIAGVYYKTDNYHLGLICLFDCLKIYRKYQDHHNQARTLKSLGTIYEYFGDPKNAVRSYESAIEAARRVKDLNLVSNAYNPLSGIYLNQGKVEKALRIIQDSISIKSKTGDIRGLAFALYGRGKVYTFTGRLQEAENDFRNAIEIHINAGEKLGLGMAYQKMGELYIAMGRLDKAKAILQKGLEFSNKYNIAIIRFKCNYLLYQVSKMENDTVKSLEYLELYLHQKEAVINTQTLKVIENYELITKMESLEKEAKLQKEREAIEEKQKRAEQSARMKQEFLSTMSHEIRTPLNAVTTISTMITAKSAYDEELMDSLKSASNNLLLVINDILDFTKLDSGKVELNNRACPFQDLLDSVIKTYGSLAHKKGVELLLSKDPALADCYELDETKLSQILGNLISNAVKYTDNGKVVLNLRKMAAVDEFDNVRFSVADTGTGIPEEYFEEIFETFSQPKSVTTRAQGGSGLGLAIVKKLTGLYNSNVTVKSKIGVGSEFTFDIKLKRANIPGRAVPLSVEGLKGKTVLLAEDNMINAMVARKLLANWGIVSEHAVNGIEAVEKARQKTFDFILMDIHMPGMNGFDATEQIRHNTNPNTATPVFALTADITAESNEDYKNYFTGFLRKPIEIDRLYMALLQVS
ncbi:tetratricopeptide repeat-containing hybrid sensor histidine kinase/response regulator [Mucilaginibacter gilvus]|uniref:histidine kinase n=1 Tax=Mucilaginibacter gilvus TaxID=2305909 RepID=A0A3S3VDT1_9SPHI|nr:tetratricopeptide repeat protein [Mucilaginibacter gilvus]RWY46216.1 tetratricopeptide repeat protein [Mucilaginibacter gilvus]